MSKQKLMLGGKINLSKIQKTALFKSEKTGHIFLDVVIFYDPVKNQYDQNGAIIQSFKKEDRPEKPLYLGNVTEIESNGAATTPVTEKDTNDLPWE